MVNKTLRLGNLHCQSCKGLIESALNEIRGVAKAEVDLSQNTCNLEFDEGKISEPAITEKIQSLGYSIQ